VSTDYRAVKTHPFWWREVLKKRDVYGRGQKILGGDKGACFERTQRRVETPISNLAPDVTTWHRSGPGRGEGPRVKLNMGGNTNSIAIRQETKKLDAAAVGRPLSLTFGDDPIELKK